MIIIHPLIEYLQKTTPPWLVAFTCVPQPNMSLGLIEFECHEYRIEGSYLYLLSPGANAWLLMDNLGSSRYERDGRDFSVAYHGAYGHCYNPRAPMWFFYFSQLEKEG